MDKHFRNAVVVGIIGLSTSLAMADADGAKGYLKEAQERIDNKDFDGATSKLELAETELDGVPAATKGPLRLRDTLFCGLE